MQQAQSLDVSERIEVDYWKNSTAERPESDSVENVINKMSVAAVLLDCLARYRELFSRAGRALELGAGQGWASCIVKAQFPNLHVTTTDISQYAVASIPKWERIVGRAPDGAYACRSYETNEADESLDLVFCFASAHHFRAHRRTLTEIKRILKPEGVCLYLYEPTAPRYLHAVARRRVNRNRPAVPEDVLVVSELRRLGGDVGLGVWVDYYPSLLRRGPKEFVYYLALSLLPPLRRLLPCTANIVFTKGSRS